MREHIVDDRRFVLVKAREHVTDDIVVVVVTDPDLQAVKNLAVQVSDDGFDAVVPTGAALLLEADLTKLEIHVIMNDDKIVDRVIIMDQLANC